VLEKLIELGVRNPESFEIENSAVSAARARAMVEMLYEKLKRRGFLERDVQAHGQSGPQRLCIGLAQAGRSAMR
jgi:malate dehydrogenase (oxaloacetate-decarboxylating)(NADP+)